MAAGYGEEIVWQRCVSMKHMSESVLLRECAWVVLSAGLSEHIVRGIFPKITSAFCGWKSAWTIHSAADDCVQSALCSFRHPGKIAAIAKAASIICEKTFARIKSELEIEGAAALCQFPFIGPITSLHLAKNLGISTAKPDRHLVRWASQFGFEDPNIFCRSIAEYVGDPIPVVDLVLWRYAVISRQKKVPRLAEA
jgi:hypothetical protein